MNFQARQLCKTCVIYECACSSQFTQSNLASIQTEWTLSVERIVMGNRKVNVFVYKYSEGTRGLRIIWSYNLLYNP